MTSIECSKCQNPEDAAWAQHLECLQRFFTEGHDMPAELTEIAGKGDNKEDSVRMLQFLHEVARVPWSDEATESAAGYNNLLALEYMHTHGAPWTATTLQWAIREDSLECVKYAHLNGSPWSDKCMKVALEVKSRKCLEFAHTHGAPFVIEDLVTEMGKYFMYSYEDSVPFKVDMLEYFISMLNDQTKLYDLLYEKSIKCTLTTMWGRYMQLVIRSMDHTFAVQVDDFFDYPYTRKWLLRVEKLLADDLKCNMSKLLPLTFRLLEKANVKMKLMEELIVESSQLPQDVVKHELMRFM